MSLIYSDGDGGRFGLPVARLYHTHMHMCIRHSFVVNHTFLFFFPPQINHSKTARVRYITLNYTFSGNSVKEEKTAGHVCARMACLVYDVGARALARLPAALTLSKK